MSKVKDFSSDTPEEVKEPSYDEILQYYYAKQASFTSNVTNFNNNLLNIINTLKELSVNENEKIRTEVDKVILKAIKTLKFEDDEE